MFWTILWTALGILAVGLEALAIFYSIKARVEQNRPKEDGYD